MDHRVAGWSPLRPRAVGRTSGSRTRAAPSTRDRSGPSSGRPRRRARRCRERRRRVHLPVLVAAAEVVAGVGADHQLAVREPADMYSPSPSGSTIGSSSDSLLQHREPLVEAIGVLVARLDVLHLAPRELLVEQVARASRARASFRTAFGGSTLATSEAARNSAADSAGVTLPGFTAGRPAPSASPRRSRSPRAGPRSRGTRPPSAARAASTPRTSTFTGSIRSPARIRSRSLGPPLATPAGRARAAALEPRPRSRDRIDARRPSRPGCGRRRCPPRPPAPVAAAGRPGRRRPSGREVEVAGRDGSISV